jgi:hypothetical protein
MAHPQCVSPSLAGALSFSVRAENRRYNVFFFSPCSPFVPLFSFFHRRLVSISKRGGDASKNRLREPPARSRPTPTAQRSATAAYNRYYSRNSYLRLKRDSRHTQKRIEKEYHRGEHTRRINTASGTTPRARSRAGSRLALVRINQTPPGAVSISERSGVENGIFDFGGAARQAAGMHAPGRAPPPDPVRSCRVHARPRHA